MRRLFFVSLLQQLRVVWPILSGVISVMVACGLVIWRIEDWRLDEALYFTFVTGLTIGYGDFSPKHVSARVLALVIGFAGIVLTGLVAAVAVKALNATDQHDEE
ncbi:potassium channel family protein [Rhizobium mayense]|uniref:Potassium channel family protein n=1 Tax=Rhizobium mayense TaxID=1312184 RepID=A0ABT7K2C6_9HYPH|nr:potassium channel family protein [Rhizobium mayense]MDL2402656.1 potassium channel family protein [Rhizobium mayense]